MARLLFFLTILTTPLALIGQQLSLNAYGPPGPTIPSGQTFSLVAQVAQQNPSFPNPTITITRLPGVFVTSGTGVVSSGWSETNTGGGNMSVTYVANATGYPQASVTVQIAPRIAQATVSSQNATVTFGTPFTPSYIGGSGTGNWQFCIGGITNFPYAGNEGGAGTRLEPSGTLSNSWNPTGVGTYSFWVRKYSDAAYQISNTPGPYTLTVNKAYQAAVVSSNQTSTYGSAFAPSSITGGSGTGNYQWLIGGHTDWPLNGESGTRSGSTVSTSWTPPAWGTYSLWVRRAGDTNHHDAAGVNYTLTVNKRSITITRSGSKAYNGNTTPAGAGYSISQGSLGSGDAITSMTYGATSSSNVGNYSIALTPIIENGTSVRTSSYNISYAGTYSITQASQSAPTVTPSQSFTYGNGYTAVASGGGGQGSLQWERTGGTASGGAIATGGAVSAESAGTVIVRARWSGNTNYTPSSYSSSAVAITVSARAITITRSGSKTYDENTAPTGAGYTISQGSLATGDAITTMTYGATSSSNVGNYSIALTPTIKNGASVRTAGYAISYNGTFAITKANQAALVLSAAPTTVNQNATSALSTTGGSGIGAVTYSIISGSGGSISGSTFTASAGTGTPGIRATKAADTNYNAINSNTVTLTLNAQPGISAFTVNGTAGNISVTYGQSVAISGTATDANSNLITHSLWWDQGNGSTWTHPLVTWGAYSANANGWSAMNFSNTASSAGTNSTRTATWNPPAAGTYQFHTNASDANNWWGPGAIRTITVNQAANTITFPSISDQFADEGQVTLNATASSGLTVSYSVTSGDAWISSGNKLNLGSTPGDVTVRASQAGNGNYVAAANVDRDFRLWGPDEDADDDGIPNWWEAQYDLDRLDPDDAHDPTPGNPSISYYEAYNGWVNPYSPTASMVQPLSAIPVNITVIAKGTGTVTVTASGTPHQFQFQATTGNPWREALLSTNPAYTNMFVLNANMGADYPITVTSSGVTDYMVKANKGVYVQPHLRQVVEFDGLNAEGITKAEVGVDGEFNLRTRKFGSVPFGQIELSRLEDSRSIGFGLGNSRTGETPGQINLSLGRWQYGEGVLGSPVITPGNEMEGLVESALKTQMKVPSGYVQISRIRYQITIDYYATSAANLTEEEDFLEEDTFIDFSGDTPLVSYSIDYDAGTQTSPAPQPSPGITPGWGQPGESDIIGITRTVGGTSTILEYETFKYEVIEGPFQGNPTTTIKNYSTIAYLWPWRETSAPRNGLTRIEYHTIEQINDFGSGPQYIYNTQELDITRYNGDSESDPVGFYEYRNTSGGDLFVASAIPIERGTDSDTHELARRKPASTGPGGLKIGPTEDLNGLGGGSYTEYLSPPAVMNGENNFDGQPVVAIGQPKYTRRNFEDNDLFSDSGVHDLVTTYDYETELIDGRAVPESAVTTQGSTQIGRTDFSYSTGTFDTKTVITTTTTSYTDASNSLTTTSTSFSRRISDLDFRGKPVSIERPDGTKTSYGYQRGLLTEGVWVPFNPILGVEGVDDLHLRVVKLTGKTGSGVSNFKTVTIEPLTLDVNRSTVTEQIIDRNGQLMRESTWLYNNNPDFVLLNSVYYFYDALGNLTAKSSLSDGTGRVFYEASFSGFRKQWEKDASGVMVSYTYDDYDRVETATRGASGTFTESDYIAAVVTTYEYDAIGRVTSETVSSPGETYETLVTAYTYDTAGRLKSRTVPGGFTTQIVYSNESGLTATDEHTKTITTFPDGGTHVDLKFKDGRKKSVTGTAVADLDYDYSYDQNGFLTATETLSSGAWTETVTDWAGRVDRVKNPTWDGTNDREVINSYDSSTGQLLSQDTKSGSTKLLPSRLFEYDAYGRLAVEGVDTNNNGSIDETSDMDVVWHYFHFENSQYGAVSQTEWYLYQSDLVYPYDQDDEGGSTDRSGDWVSAWQTYTQVSGLTDSMASHVYSADFDRNWTDTVTSVDRTNKLSETEVDTDGTTETIREVYRNGFLVETENVQGHITLQAYDGLGRLEKVLDPRIDAVNSGNGWTERVYIEDSILLAGVSSPDGYQATFAYDTGGRVAVELNNEGKASRYTYDAMGNLTKAWGDVPNPVSYTYNELGQRTEMYTYQSGTWTGTNWPGGTGNKTTWNYQASTGLLASKVDADNETTSFRYDDVGRLAKRIDARDWETWYSYYDVSDATSADFNGLQKLIDYRGVSGTNADDPAHTPDVFYTYHRSGKLKTAADGTGTRSFNYYESWTSSSELRNKSGRLQAETLPTAAGGQTITYDYEYGVSGRMNGGLMNLQYANSSTYDVDYAYDNKLRLSTIGYKSFTPFTYTYESNSNLIDNITQWTGGGNHDYQREYDYRTDSNRADNTFHRFGSSSDATVETRLAYDTLNLYENQKVQGVDLMDLLFPASGYQIDYDYTDRLEVNSSGFYELNSSWVKGSTISNTDRSYAYDPIGNRTADQNGAYSSNAVNEYTTTPYSSTFVYDANGNLTNDGFRTFEYDGENRLIKVIITASSDEFEYQYDYLGRRVSKSGDGIAETRYVYDGWNLIAELNSSNIVQRTFVWGTDASGTLRGAGGVGGLLMIEDGSSRYFPVYDASFNIIALYDNNGNTDAVYAYDSHGYPIAVEGTYADQNPFRYSTKYTDNETGLVYYGLRYYFPLNGRFVNRDPIEETGGLNLYGFVGNNPVNGYDYLGMNFGAIWDNIKDSFGRGDGQPQDRVDHDEMRRLQQLDTQADFEFVFGGNAYADVQSVVAIPGPYDNVLPVIPIDPSSGADILPVVPLTPAEALEVAAQMQAGGVIPVGVGQPGTLEGIIPIWGSARASIDDFQNGRYVWGSVSAVVAVTDVFLVKAVVVAAGKVIGTVVVKVTAKEFAERQVGRIVTNATNTGLEAFSRADDFGIQSYRSLKSQLKGTGLEAHHLLEKRFADILGLKPNDMASIALTKAEHEAFTKAWRQAIPYSNSGSALNTATATADDVMNAARQIYRDNPAILKALGL